METIDNQMSDGESGVKFTSQIKKNLTETAKWANFLAIVGFVMLGFIVVGVLSMFGIGTTRFGGVSIFAIGFVYLLMAVLYFFPSYFLFLFARKIKIGLKSSIQSEVDLAFLNLKKLFKFVGILMLIMISIYILFFLFGIILSVGRL